MISLELKKLFKKIKINSKHIVKNKESLSFLLKEVNYKPTQSENIRIGLFLETLFTLFIEKHTEYFDIKPKTKKGTREKDLLLKHNNIIIYAEFKGNLNLDSEKHKSTYNKVLKIEKDLINNNSDCKIKTFFVGLRYLYFKDIPNHIQAKYKILKDKVVGINEFLKVFNIKGFKDYKEYQIFLKDFYLYCFRK